MTREEYIRSLYVQEDPALKEVLRSIEEQDMPSISIAPESGKLLTLLVKMCSAKEVLEIGALGGYSGICLLRGAGSGGHLTSLEISEKHIEIARRNLEKAGFQDQVSYYAGDAGTSLQKLKESGKKFDFFFIDADKGNYTNYLHWAVRLGRPGAVITVDNTLWRDRVWNEEEQNKMTQNVRKFNQEVAEHPELESLLVPIGDGLTVARLIDDDES